MSIEVQGYVIVPPSSPFRTLEENRLIVADLSYSSFGKTVVEAWHRHMGAPFGEERHVGEFSRKVQFWHDRGYRVREAKMIIEDDR